nr:hypothetical protein [Tanacetum cinerariifolium]
MNSYTFMGLDDVEEGEKISSREKSFIKRATAYSKRIESLERSKENSIGQGEAGLRKVFILSLSGDSFNVDDKHKLRVNIAAQKPKTKVPVFSDDTDCTCSRAYISPISTIWDERTTLDAFKNQTVVIVSQLLRYATASTSAGTSDRGPPSSRHQ